MMPVPIGLLDGHTWLRVAKVSWLDPLDTGHAKRNGGRWNPPQSHATLYLNEDLTTARAQLPRMLDGYPATPEDLDDEFILVRATLPSGQVVADAVTDEGLDALGLPSSYPTYANGRPVRHTACQPIGAGCGRDRPPPRIDRVGNSPGSLPGLPRRQRRSVIHSLCINGGTPIPPIGRRP